MIDGAPQVKHLAIDPDEHLVQVSAPVGIGSMMNPTFPDLGSKHRTEPVPPEPYRFVADVDAALGQDILDLAERKRVSNVQHHRQTDDLRRRIEIAERIFHPTTLPTPLARLKPICSDSAAAPLRCGISTETSRFHRRADSQEFLLPCPPCAGRNFSLHPGPYRTGSSSGCFFRWNSVSNMTGRR
jgi:hypothetical protein